MPVLQNIASSPSEGGAQLDFSDTGRWSTCVTTEATTAYPIVWVDRDGQPSTLLRRARALHQPATVSRRQPPRAHRASRRQLGHLGATTSRAVCRRGSRSTTASRSSRSGRPTAEYLIFSSDRAGPGALYRKRADGSGEAERLTEPRFAQWATRGPTDAVIVAFMETGPVRPRASSISRPVRRSRCSSTRFAEGFADFSPNGRWLAYASNESGQYQVYVRPFPSGEGKWQVSDSSGTTPRWRARRA